ncbi:RNA polymerase factor sigma-54 [Halobacillus rhizosphaerae]|uniref:RNA polymerase factor sigma-54 n=1 Tax=Halobacillus rhizosphaerae TaxID=3064889 RepID=UPI00398AB348
MKQQLHQEQSVQMKLSKQLQLGVHLLQLPGIELREYIQKEVLDNPLLEPLDSSQDLPMQSNGYELRETAYAVNGREKLKLQMKELGASAELEAAGIHLIDYINDEGYLTISGEEWDKLGYGNREVFESACGLLHQLEPVGIGARGIQECFILQLQRKKNAHLAVQIVKDYFFDLKNIDFDRIQASLGCTIDELYEALDQMKDCSIHPGRGLISEGNQKIVPEAFIYVVQGKVEFSLNSWCFPQVRVNAAAFDSADEEAAVYIEQKHKEAIQLQKLVTYRSSTFTDILKWLLDYQEAYFTNGLFMLKPLRQQDVADELNVHVSTISRTIANKYIQTENGVLSLAFLFSSSVPMNNGQHISSSVVKHFIKEWVGKEEAEKPYSDEQISKDLQSNYGVLCARRTISKYRESMGIPASRVRKKLKGAGL